MWDACAFSISPADKATHPLELIVFKFQNMLIFLQNFDCWVLSGLPGLSISVSNFTITYLIDPHPFFHEGNIPPLFPIFYLEICSPSCIGELFNLWSQAIQSLIQLAYYHHTQTIHFWISLYHMKGHKTLSLLVFVYYISKHTIVWILL